MIWFSFKQCLISPKEELTCNGNKIKFYWRVYDFKGLSLTARSKLIQTTWDCCFAAENGVLRLFSISYIWDATESTNCYMFQKSKVRYSFYGFPQKDMVNICKRVYRWKMSQRMNDWRDVGYRLRGVLNRAKKEWI